ncbi:Rhomboid-like protein 15 [Bienertia sinuspersici]
MLHGCRDEVARTYVFLGDAVLRLIPKAKTPRSETAPSITPDSNLQTRLLDGSNGQSDITAINSGGGRSRAVDSATELTGSPQQQALVASDEDIQRLVAMGFDKTQVEVALAAADGDLDVAVEILMTQQVKWKFLFAIDSHRPGLLGNATESTSFAVDMIELIV